MKPRKARGLNVTLGFLKERSELAERGGWEEPKWIGFCRTLIAAGFYMSLYEAKETRSKYITVKRGEKSFKVRFSNHRPSRSQEEAGDSDFYVGVANHVTHTTADALKAVADFFKEGAKE